MDRCESFSTNGGPVGAETMQAMYTNGCTAKAINIMYGIGGRDVTVGDMRGVYDTLEEIAKQVRPVLHTDIWDLEIRRQNNGLQF